MVLFCRVWVNQPIHSFFVGCRNPSLQGTTVLVRVETISFVRNIGVVGVVCRWLLDTFPSNLEGVPPKHADFFRLWLRFVGFGRTNPYARSLLVAKTLASKEPLCGFVWWQLHPWEIWRHQTIFRVWYFWKCKLVMHLGIGKGWPSQCRCGLVAMGEPKAGRLLSHILSVPVLHPTQESWPSYWPLSCSFQVCELSPCIYISLIALNWAMISMSRF